MRPVAQPTTVRLFLASRSPRRRALLDEAGFDHGVVESGVDDGDLTPGAVSPQQWVAALAYLKARAGAEGMAIRGECPARNWTILGADTVCLKDGAIVGQPRDAEEARRILATLEDGGHDVLTGVALVSVTPNQRSWRAVGAGQAMRRRALFVDRASVRVGTLGRDRIEEYVASGHWRGKAGAYNLRERLEAGWPIEYVGDPTTIMGLPMGVLRNRLARLMEDP